MNLIEIAEDLKDVPDQYLMQEIQQPTGNFPAYLVVSELSRRKRMRDKVSKEMPSQTVAQELATPPQMPPQAGLMAMPQAQTELAAQDAMGTTPPEMMMPTQTMAGGGIVSFRDGGDVQRFQNQGLVEATSPFGRFMGYDTTRKLQEEQRLRDQIRNQFGMAAGPLGFFKNQTDEERAKAQDIIGRLNTMSLEELKALSGQTESPTASPSAAPASPAADPAGDPKAAPVVVRDERFVVPPPPAFSRDVGSSASRFPEPKEFVGKTAEQFARARSEGIKSFEEAIPDRITPLMTESISKRERDLEGRRDSNINEALIQAGLGIMGSKSPRFLSAISEGGTAGLNAFRQGAKDIRQSEEALFASRAKMAEAQTLRDQGKFGASQNAYKDAMALDNQARESANTLESQRVKRIELGLRDQEIQQRGASDQYNANINRLKLEMEADLNPTRKLVLEAQIKQLEAAAEASRRPKALSGDELINARISLAGRNIKPPYSPEQLNEEVMRLRGMSPTGTPAATEIDYNRAISGP